MKLILDTHVVLCSLLDPTRLSNAMKKALEEPNNELYVSSITAWEILILLKKKQINLETNDPSDWIRRNFKEIPLVELPINNEIAMQSRLIDLPQKDPADRFIAATAIVHNMVLVTSDKMFRKNKELKLVY